MRGVTIAVIAITGTTAVAGVVILVLLVQGVQWGGDLIASYINRKRYKFD